MGDNKGFDVKIFLKNITKSIEDYGKLQGRQSEIKSKLLSNQIQLNQNWLFKQRQEQASPAGQGRQQLRQQFQTQAPEQVSPFQSHVRRGTAGMLEQYHPSGEYGEFGRLKKATARTPEQEKRFRGLEREIYKTGGKDTAIQKEIRDYQEKSAAEGWTLEVDKTLPPEQQLQSVRQLYAERVGRKPEKLTSAQQIAKSNALQMLERGEFADRQEAEDYLIEEFKVDITDPEIQQALEQYKVSGEEGKKGWFKKYPRKTKFGYEYEKREDEKWHKLD